jgi:hypothetical protein
MTTPYNLELEQIPQSWLPDLAGAVHVASLLSRLHLGDQTILSDPEPEEREAETAWASDVVGRTLACYYHWDDNAWSIEKSGILAAPVYYDRDRQQAQLVKSTVKPVPPDLTGCWRWVAELKTHCYLLGCRGGVLHVHHAETKAQEAVLLAYGFTFEQKSLEATWDVLLDLRRKWRTKENL